MSEAQSTLAGIMNRTFKNYIMHSFTSKIILYTGLEPVEQVSQSFFSDGLFDSRYVASDILKFPPTSEISHDPIEIILPHLKSNSTYRLDLAVIVLKLSLRKEDNTKLDNTSLSAVRYDFT